MKQKKKKKKRGCSSPRIGIAQVFSPVLTRVPRERQGTVDYLTWRLGPVASTRPSLASRFGVRGKAKSRDASWSIFRLTSPASIGVCECLARLGLR